MPYEHTQRGNLMIALAILLAILFAFISKQSGFVPSLLFFEGFVLVLLLSFAWLTVRIDQKQLHVQFGPGLFQKRFLLSDIKSVKAVRNRWYYGWGIRYWIFRPMWIYNVSGFDAVEIILKNGKVYRIGTDEPQKLEMAIKQNL